MTRDELIDILAGAIRSENVCGYNLKGEIVYCDDPRMADDLRCDHCSCKCAARAALSAIEESGITLCQDEPTEEMIIQAAKSMDGIITSGGGTAIVGQPKDVYRAMLSASPLRDKSND